MTFELKTVRDDEPLNLDPFFDWLNANVDRCNPGPKIIQRYLESLGFVIGQDRITEGQHKTLNYVLEVWFRCMPYHLPMTLGECFTPGTDFHVRGIEGDQHNITPELKKAVEGAGWIYAVEPSTTYFEVNGGRLFAIYQQILGSRFICTIKEAI